MRLKNICKVLGVVAALTLVGCGGAKQATETTVAETTTVAAETTKEETTSAEETKAESKGDASAVNVFAAASLKGAIGRNHC